MSDPTITALGLRLVDVSTRMYQTTEHRVGMRSGMMDAAAVCDGIAAEIGRGRPSKAKRQMVEVAKRCAAAIDGMRNHVEVPT